MSDSSDSESPEFREQKAPAEAFLPERLEVLEELGRGGMAVVYLCHDSGHDRKVAVKCLPPAFGGAETLQRFEREAAGLATLSHPAVVSFYGFGKHRDQVFLEMEYLEGGNLLEWLEGVRQGDWLPQLLRQFARICDGLEAVHNRGIVHRDLKPENILFTTDGQAKIADFGLARDLSPNSMKLTNAGTIMGTCAYLAPEQIMQAENVGAQADLYSLGVCLFEAVTGRLPFPGPHAAQMMQGHLADEPPVPSSILSDIPPELDKIILLLLDKETKKQARYRVRCRQCSADHIGRQVFHLGNSPPRAPFRPWQGAR